MRHNSASKSQAIALIKTAKAAGFKRVVSVLKIGDREPIATQVSLSAFVQVGGIYDHVHVIISFRRGSKLHRSSVAISSRTSFQKKKKSDRGLWHARYAVTWLIEDAVRLSRADRPVSVQT